jgi:hypothetical protein
MTGITFHHQFILSPSEPAQQDGWQNYCCGGYWLMAHPSLPVSTVVDKDGDHLGYALGWPIGSSGRMIQTQIRLPFGISEESINRLERVIYSFGGRYAFVILHQKLKRLYLDAGGTLSAVFSEKRRMAGSTVSVLVKDEPDHRLWSKPTGEFPDNRPNQYWPAGTTLDPDISRLLPNHYLDLENWRAVRHYPSSALENIPDNEVTDCIERVVSLLRRHILAVVESTPKVYMPLTAGQDSRMLLACSRTWTDKIEYVTFDYRPWRRKGSDQIDLYISQRLAKQFALRRLVIPIPLDLPPGTELAYLHRIGYAGGAGKSRDFFWSCQEHLDLSAAWLTGFAGGVGRAFYWRAGDKATDKMSPAGLLNRMGFPASDRLQDAVRLWLHDLPEVSLLTMLELAHLEHRVGCWASPHFYGTASFAVNLTPFCHRDIFDIMLRLPSTYHSTKALPYHIISAAWPDLHSLPYNDYPGLRRLLKLSSWMGRSKQKARSAVQRLLQNRVRGIKKGIDSN